MQEKMASRNSVRNISLPGWEELPKESLYMEQVTTFVNQCLPDFATGSKAALTPTMINNYVKARVIPAPVKKKYSCETVAMLIVIVTLKPLFNIQEIGEIIQSVIRDHPVDTAYEFYRNTLQNAFRRVAENQPPEIHYQDDYKLGLIENVCTAAAYQMDTKYRLAERRTTRN